MVIYFDNDATLTEYISFIKKVAIPFYSKRGLKVINQTALEIEDIFEFEKYFSSQGMTQMESIKASKKLLDKFWVGIPFLRYTLFTKMKPGVKAYICALKKEGNTIEIHSSRAKTCEKTIVGRIARMLTYLQFWKNGIWVSRKQFVFYKNDAEKISSIIEKKPHILFEDKPYIVHEMNKAGIKTICVKDIHNSNIEETKNVAILDGFTTEEIELCCNKLYGIKNRRYLIRETESQKFFKQISFFGKILHFGFHPIVLHKENLIVADNTAIIFAPNHRSTLDPLVIESIIMKEIHWAALLRFFEGKDSIFNNSKNPLLCKITAWMFRKLEYFPIERKRDNETANNYDSIKDMCGFLKINARIGIFSEGTTRREEGKEFSDFDDAFITLARKYDAWIQPITMLWIRDKKTKSKVIVNFRTPFKVGKMTVDEAMEHFITLQWEGLRENLKVKEG